MLSSADVLYSKGGNDECYTPERAVLPILQYLRRDWTYWLPFDTEQSNFFKVLDRNGFRTVKGHISEGKDFYAYEPEQWDAMLSNPPFTNKAEVFRRAIGFGKPFALLMTLTWLNDAAPKRIFGNDLQLLMFEERVAYERPMASDVFDKPTFSSAYYGYRFFPSQILVDSIKRY